MIFGNSATFLPKNPNDFCDGLKQILQEEQAVNNSNITGGEIVALADKLLEYKCMSAKLHKLLLSKCLH